VDLTETKQPAPATDPATPENLTSAAAALLGQGKLPEAVAQLEGALSLDADWAAALRLLAQVHVRLKAPQKALTALRRLVRARPDDLEARDELTDLLLASGRRGEALLQAEAALAHDPTAARRYVRLADLYRRARLPLQAVEALRRASVRLPDELSVASELARMRQELGLPGSAAVLEEPPLEQVKQALEMEQVQTAASTAGLDEVLELLRAGDVAGAKRELVVAPKRSHTSSVYHLVRAELLLLEGDSDAAEAAYQRALEAFPALTTAAIRLGDLLGSRKDREAALAQYEIANADGHPLGADRIAALNLRLSRELLNRPTVGRILLMAWDSTGGAVVPIEAQSPPGAGTLRLHGNIGPAGREAAATAFEFLQSHAGDLDIVESLASRDLHIIFNDDAVGPEDGASAALPLLLVMYSALASRPIRPRLAATGCLDAAGAVLPVKGLAEKLAVASLTGVEIALYPRALVDGEAMPEELAGQLIAAPVDSAVEALQLAFVESGVRS